MESSEKRRWRNYAALVGVSLGRLCREGVNALIEADWVPEQPVVEPVTIAGLEVGPVERALRDMGYLTGDEDGA